MKLEIVRIFIPLSAAIIAFFLGVVLFLLAKQGYTKIKSKLNPQKYNDFLDKVPIANSGKLAKYGVQITSLKFTMLKISLTLGFFVFFLIFDVPVFFAVPVSIAMFFLPELYLKMRNENDNKIINHDMYYVYLSFMTQIKSDVFVTDIMKESTKLVKSERLKRALTIYRRNLTKEGTKQFIDSFDNRNTEVFSGFIGNFLVHGSSEAYIQTLFSNNVETLKSLSHGEVAVVESKASILKVLFMICLLVLIAYIAISVLNLRDYLNIF